MPSRLASRAAPSLPRSGGENSSPASSVDAQSAIRDALHRVSEIALADSSDTAKDRALGVQCRKAAEQLGQARSIELPTLASVGHPLPESLDQDLILLGDLLLVRAERGQISPSRQAKGETWTDVARRAVVAAESEGYADEQAALKRILADARVNCEVHSVRHTDLTAVHHLTNRWVVLLPIDGEDLDLTSVADRLTEEERSRLAFRTFFIFESDGRLSPLGSLKLGSEAALAYRRR